MTCKDIINNTRCIFICNTLIYDSHIKKHDKLSLENINKYVEKHYGFNCSKCKNIVFNRIKKKYYCTLQCNQDESNIIIQSKISEEDVKYIIKKVYSMNCIKCNNIIFDKLTIKYKCILQCKHYIDKQDIQFIKTQNSINFKAIDNYIDHKYINNCENCKKEIYNKIFNLLYYYIVNERLKSFSDVTFNTLLK